MRNENMGGKTIQGRIESASFGIVWSAGASLGGNRKQDLLEALGMRVRVFRIVSYGFHGSRIAAAEFKFKKS
jgi:hypothetical protein